jgi:hypothetical protein
MPGAIGGSELRSRVSDPDTQAVEDRRRTKCSRIEHRMTGVGVAVQRMEESEDPGGCCPGPCIRGDPSPGDRSCLRGEVHPRCVLWRNAEPAAAPADGVLSQEPIRQRAPSFPYPLRFLIRPPAGERDPGLGVFRRTLVGRLTRSAARRLEKMRHDTLTRPRCYFSAHSPNVRFQRISS